MKKKKKEKAFRVTRKQLVERYRKTVGDAQLMYDGYRDWEPIVLRPWKLWRYVSRRRGYWLELGRALELGDLLGVPGDTVVEHVVDHCPEVIDL